MDYSQLKSLTEDRIAWRR